MEKNKFLPLTMMGLSAVFERGIALRPMETGMWGAEVTQDLTWFTEGCSLTSVKKETNPNLKFYNVRMAPNKFRKQRIYKGQNISLTENILCLF
jgi:hypothetical protein